MATDLQTRLLAMTGELAGIHGIVSWERRRAIRDELRSFCSDIATKLSSAERLQAK